MRPIYYILIGAIIPISFYFLFLRNTAPTPSNNPSIDSLRGRTEIIKEIYHTGRIESKKVVYKWDTFREVIHDTFNLDSANCNAKLAECTHDIDKMEKALNSCDSLESNHSKLTSDLYIENDKLRNKKESLFIPTVGLGISLNSDYQVRPSINAGLGLNINRIFGKK